MPWYVWPFVAYFGVEVIIGLLMMTIWRENKSQFPVLLNMVFHLSAIILVLIGWYENTTNYLEVIAKYLFVIYSILAAYQVYGDVIDVFFVSEKKKDKLIDDAKESFDEFVVAAKNPSSEKDIGEKYINYKIKKARVEGYHYSGLIFLVCSIAIVVYSSYTKVFS